MGGHLTCFSLKWVGVLLASHFLVFILMSSQKSETQSEKLFINVEYRIKPTSPNLFCRDTSTSSTEEKVILKGITGLVLPGEMLAMLGPSGSGKTTLLTALGGRLNRHYLSGTITYNDKPFSKSMTRNMGFVMQDDVFFPHLTVAETLVFTARLRLPGGMSKEEKVRQAMSVIKLLGLSHCKDSIIGETLLRGVSGGERKRVSIGQEMLINPSLLFLDEPTSGLDSTTAQRIVSTLGELAGDGRTVVLTIHQPSSRIFYMFHKAILLSDGHPIYFGKASEALDYFASVGHSLVVAMNPADFLLDLANGIPADGSEVGREVMKQALVSAYKHENAEKLGLEVSKIEVDKIKGGEASESGRWSTSWWQEFVVLLERGVKEGKHASFSVIRLIQIVFVTFLTGLLWWKSDPSNIQDKTGLLFFYTTFWILVPMFQSIFTFPPERPILVKERSSGLYRLSSYVMAKMVGDMPMELLLPTLFTVVSYWMAGLNPGLTNFLQALLIILFAVLVAQGLGLALGALIMDLKTATTLGSICSLTFLLTAGYYVQHVPAFITWIKYISLTHYTYLLLLDSQYSFGETYDCGQRAPCMVRDFPSIKLVGLGYKGSSLLAMFLMLVVYRLIAYVALTRIGAKP